ncbi:MAG: glycerol-3-phosphate dehydrogenase [Pseudomonadales bacterium]|nr:glycerol-3-phosphate dehydrogenase [Pseudomonadales bacterium]MCP5358943.1 glycerol-3-phosphate dehydrogenase [Pseudomonadales bacterium]
MNQNTTVLDLLVVGGGINGVGIAADAAGRGLSVLLCEAGDLAGATSSASTKLIHGGLRYLEQYEFALVRKALAEREVLLRNAPHIIHPMRFVLPYRPHLRPRWMIRAGLFLYDSLSRRVSLPASRSVRFAADNPLNSALSDGFEYSDCQVDDARLVVLVAQQAREHGARICVRRECVGATEEDGQWRVTLRDTQTGQTEEVRARALVNATGPWVERFANGVLPTREHRHIRLVKGCHIVVPKLFDSPEAYLLQNEDGRVVFVIPYEQDFSLIGTTEEDVPGDPAQARIADWEIEYLCRVVNECFKTQVSPEMVRHVFVGVRPLIAEEHVKASEVSRDYTIELNVSTSPLLTVYGGKITTYRHLAEDAMQRLRQVFPELGPAWTGASALPGGDFSSREVLTRDIQARCPWLPDDMRARFVRSYGTLCWQILDGARALDDLGQDFGHGLTAREVDYLCAREWARSCDDILWRRSKLGLRFSEEQGQALAEYLKSRDAI